MALNITFPTARIVGGSLYKLSPSKDNNNNPKVDKEGKVMNTSFFAVAIPKGVETAWWSTPWGQQVLAQGAADMPANYQHPQFAWKIEDGDSQVPNKRGRKNAEREGYPGHWIIKFSSSFLPDVCTLLDPSKPGKPVRVMQENFVQAGSWVQVAATIAGNKRTDSPGIYMNPNIVCLVAYGAVMNFGLDPDEAGFQATALPPGASLTPVGAVAAPAGPPAVAPAPAPAAPPPVGLPATLLAPAPVAPAPVPVAPHQTILAAAPPPPAAPAAPPPPAGLRPTAAAQFSYADYIASGWTDAALIQHGLFIA